MRLPRLPGGDEYGRDYQCVFPGLDERLSAGDGAVAAMENMSSDCHPLLSPRGARYKVNSLPTPQGMGASEELCWAADGVFYYGGEARGDLTLSGDKRFHALNKWLTIWPDKLFYNTETGQFGSLEASVTLSGQADMAVFCSMASPGGISSEKNCLLLQGVSLGDTFAPGQAVTISGCQAHPENNQTLVIREVAGSALYFYDESFTLDEVRTCAAPAEGIAAGLWNYDIDGALYYLTLETDLACGDVLRWKNDGTVTAVTAAGETTALVWSYGAFGSGWLEFGGAEYVSCGETVPVTVSREVPELDHLCRCDNRLWGTEGDTIRCCALGDPRVWHNFDGTATGCWAVESGSGEPFTGAFAYGGYPLLFQENRLFRVYGTKPANYQLLETETLGCEAGSEKSFAVVGQTLYYKSRAGICAYGGGVPALVDEALGPVRRKNAVGATDGRKYYVSLEGEEGRSLYVYDTLLRLWHREDDLAVKDMVWWDGELHALTESGEVFLLGRVRTPAGEAEGAVESYAEFAPFHAGDMGRKALRRVYLRVQTEGTLTLSVAYDNGEFQPVQTVTAAPGCALRTLRLIPRRCDCFRLRLEGTGPWRLWAMGREYYAGTPE